jgi:hypothetical protein
MTTRRAREVARIGKPINLTLARTGRSKWGNEQKKGQNKLIDLGGNSYYMARLTVMLASNDLV